MRRTESGTCRTLLIPLAACYASTRAPPPAQLLLDMPLTRWNDDRLDDLALSVRAQSGLIPTVAEHEVTLEQHTRALTAVSATQAELAVRLTASDAAFRWTPAAIAPIIIGVLTLAGVILTRGGAG